MRVYTLLDNITRVPLNLDDYVNKNKFNKSLLNLFDTAVVYEEFNKEKNILERFNFCQSCQKRYLVYRFYPNGCFNVFAFEKDKLPLIERINPNFSGGRGVYYLEKNEIKFDEFSAIDQFYNIGKITGTFKVNGDTIFVRQDDRKGLDAQSYSTEIYIKRKLPKEYFTFKADW
jgi:hypothetical protein